MIDGVECGSVDIPMYLSIMSSVGASVGYDHGSPVSLRYESTYPFTGTLHQIDIELVPPQDQGEQNRIETATNEAEAFALQWPANQVRDTRPKGRTWRHYEQPMTDSRTFRTWNFAPQLRRSGRR